MKLGSTPPVVNVVICGFVAGQATTDGARFISEAAWFGWPALLVGAAVFYLLVRLLRGQGLRGLDRGNARWTGSDTAIAAIVMGFGVLAIVAGVVGDPASSKALPNLTVAAVYLGLAADYVIQRRSTAAGNEASR